MTASEEQPLSPLGAAERHLGRQRDRLDAALGTVDDTLITIDRTREEIDGILTGLPELHAMVARRIALPDVAADPLRGDPRWVPVEVTLDEGIRFTVVLDPDVHDPVTAGLATGRPSDQNLLSLMLQITGPGDHVLDLGSHVGVFALTAAAAGCGVVAVEASPDNAALLQASAARNGFHDLRVVNAVVGKMGGNVSFQPNGPWGHMTWDANEESDSVSLPAVRVDDLTGAFAFGKVKFVKIDVEGSELLALEGMGDLLAGPDAPPLLIESNGHALAFASATPNDLLARLESLGYVCYQVDANRLTRLDASQIQVETVIECLAVKRRPAGLGGWEVRPSMTAEDRLLRIVAESHHPNPDCRVYVARTLALLEEDVLTHPLVSAALEDLRNDGAADVRAAVAWSAGLAPAGRVP